MQWVVIALVLLISLLVVVLSIPIDVTVRLEVYNGLKWHLWLSFLFGLVRKEIPLKRPVKPEKQKPDIKRKAGKWGIRSFMRMLKILRLKGLLRQLRNLITGLVRCVHIKSLEMDLRLGLGDPADTGLLFAVVGPAVAFLGRSRYHQVRVAPSFEDRAAIEGYSYGILSLRPIELTLPVIKFIFSPAVLRAAKLLILSKWKKKR